MSEDDEAQTLANKFFGRIGDWGLEWEVLTFLFLILNKQFDISYETINSALEEALREWDV